MPNSSSDNDAIILAMTTLAQKVDATSEQLRDVRERLIRIESHENRIEKLTDRMDEVLTRLTVLEVNGKTYAIGIAAAVSVGFILFEKVLLPIVMSRGGP